MVPLPHKLPSTSPTTSPITVSQTHNRPVKSPKTTSLTIQSAAIPIPSTTYHVTNSEHRQFFLRTNRLFQHRQSHNRLQHSQWPKWCQLCYPRHHLLEQLQSTQHLWQSSHHLHQCLSFQSQPKQLSQQLFRLLQCCRQLHERCNTESIHVIHHAIHAALPRQQLCLRHRIVGQHQLHSLQLSVYVFKRIIHRYHCPLGMCVHLDGAVVLHVHEDVVLRASRW